MSRSMALGVMVVVVLAGLALFLNSHSQRPARKVEEPTKHAAVIDPQALAVLRRSQEAMLALHTYAAEWETTQTDLQRGNPVTRIVTQIWSARPNKLCYRTWPLTPAQRGYPSTEKIICDGQCRWQLITGNAYYRYDELSLPRLYPAPWGIFFDGDNSTYAQFSGVKTVDGQLELRLDKPAVIGGVLCDTVVSHTKRQISFLDEEWETWWISRDGLIRRHQTRYNSDGKPASIREDLPRRIQANGPIPAKQFQFVPPPGALLAVWNDQEKTALLQPGGQAPDFTGTKPDGSQIRLAALRGQIVVLDFWSSWNGAWPTTLSSDLSVVKRLRAAGHPAVLLAVNSSDDMRGFTTWIKKNAPDTPEVIFALDANKQRPNQEGLLDRYQLKVIPAQFVLSRQGTIRAATLCSHSPNPSLEKDILAAETAP